MSMESMPTLEEVPEEKAEEKKYKVSGKEGSFEEKMKAIEETPEEEAETKENPEHRKIIEGATNLEELYNAIDKIGDIETSSGKIISPDKMNFLIHQVLVGEKLPNAITRNLGLRDKVWELIEIEMAELKKAS